MDTTIMTAIVTVGLGAIIARYLTRNNTKQQNEMLKYIMDSNTLNNERTNKNIEDTNKILDKLTKVVGNTYLDEYNSVALFNAQLCHHMIKKSDFIQNDILVNNHLATRRKEIENRIRVEFLKITEEEKTILSSFNTHAGDLSSYFEYIDFEEFLQDTYKIVFREGDNATKIKDLRSLMEGLVTVMIGEIKRQFNIFNNK